MKIIGLLIVAFSIVVINKALGFTEEASLFGAVLGSGVYILLQMEE